MKPSIKPDSVLRSEGMSILLEKLGKVDVERFISLLIKEPFDYTKWQSDLMQGMSVKKLSSKAMKSVNEKQ